MGTAVGLDLREPWVPARAVDRFFSWLRSVDSRFSTFKPDSMVSRLRRGEITITDTDDDFHQVLSMCQEVKAASAGAFDIWASDPEGVDPSGLVKGWSIDRGAAILRDAGASNFCVNAGGDVLACGEPSPGQRWRIGIQHPVIRDRMARVLSGCDIAVATSGAYERGEHIVDPISGKAPAGLLSLTIAGPSLAYADAYSTAGFAMGLDGVDWMANLDGYAGLAITTDHRTVWSAGFEPLLGVS